VFGVDPASPTPYTWSGTGSWNNPAKPSIAAATLVDNGDGTLTYTDVNGGTVTWFDGDGTHAVTVTGEYASYQAFPNVVAAAPTPFGPVNPLTVTIVNPSVSRPMAVMSTGTGPELNMFSTVAASGNYAGIRTRYSVNGVNSYAHTIGSAVAVPLTSGEARAFRAHGPTPSFVAVIPPAGSWFLRIATWEYVLTAALTSSATNGVNGERISLIGVNTS